MFISHRYINNYDFASFSENDRLVAIILDSCKNLFPTDKKKYFSFIYTIPHPSNNSGPLIKFDYNDVKSILLKELKKTNKSDLNLICIDEVNLILAGQLRDELGLPGPKESELLKFQDKILMKESLPGSLIPLPIFTKFDRNEVEKNPKIYFNSLKRKLGDKFILKPTRYTGSFGVFLIHNYDEFTNFLNSGNHLKYEYEADQFINGALYHSDIALKNGEVIFADCCKYSCPNLEFSFGKIIASLVLNPKDPLKQDLISTSLKSLTALGLMSGTFHAELFVTPNNEIYFLEVAARPAGGLVAFMYEKLTGINLFTLDLLIALNREIPDFKYPDIHCLQALVPINQETIKQFKNI